MLKYVAFICQFYVSEPARLFRMFIAALHFSGQRITETTAPTGMITIGYFISCANFTLTQLYISYHQLQRGVAVVMVFGY